MPPAVRRDLREPRAGHHGRAARDQPKVNEIGQGRQAGLAHANVVRVDDDGAVSLAQAKLT